ncbi:MAG: bifunctional phosphoribosylaminoimidazolecarboxamide formyltransferase/IMP cyclohydrolase [Devosia sp.]|uniref:bifunctional phosphoribosylaminoimidazolecarboxamide formyltransferase/IMP cyclohydrolase n=1 Tax=unclassified Devosia TaxID=196773 RepID=UPI0019D95E7F|nr:MULTISPECIES: bifunctional phosphoribosylaminoimidazolecarboxamide formyltransferase/IMP cyclohydrolase [unclassified Devosia]MBF0678482.1 bifunctional phosphoribosylaminoimidazolecarboxamide formyltransferase/IMP cyclohydrolase [Devosia sp.]WEJ33147.1 bifunctional phosphoribosylaminoimidazolecarboxamide formyltransferase/IMP cyclohydrolase [Devosia sp. SD17-2]
MGKTVKVGRALLSVFDKSGMAEFARGLSEAGVELVSTGGTHKLIKETGLPVREISDLTGFPEMMDGRVKTLHPKVHGGLLSVRDNPEHKASMDEHEIGAIDLVAVNLYPFEKTVASGASYDEIIENIDIGGPAMVRSAAKNHAYVTVVVDPADYPAIIEAIKNGGIPFELRQKLAAKAYARTAAYDSAISSWFAREIDFQDVTYRSFAGTLSEVMRYGENPHQWAAFYKTGENRPGVATATQTQGKTLSYNNINDTDAAFELVSEFDPAETAAVAIIKHANPCGVAVGATLLDAYTKALRTDPVSAFGGIVALNREIDAETATEIVKVFTEVIVAPSATQEAQDIIAAKKNLRLLLTGGLADPKADGLLVKSVSGGLLVQGRDNRNVDDCELKVVTKRQPTEAELADLKLAAKVAKHVKSNAIIYVKDGATAGIGAGQMSRVDSARVAHRKSIDAAEAAGIEGALTIGSVVASDAFFPFADGLEALVAAGATAVIQPGGSMRDDEVIAAADAAGIAMVLTGMRHFRH